MISAEQHTDGYWLGSLSMAAALALQAYDQKEANHILRRTLREFLDSPIPRDELRGMLREEMNR